MFPRSTKYRLATSPADYKACRALFADNHGADPTNSLSFPTVMAERDGQLVGFLSTQPTKGVLRAGPLEIAGGKNMITFLRLVEAYENVLRAAGVTRYLFATRVGREDAFDPAKLRTYERLGLQFLRYENLKAFFVKEISHG